MRAPIALRRELELEQWHVKGTLAFATRRTWEPAVLKLACEQGHVSPRSVSGELLGGRTNVATRLVHICASLGLLEQQGDRWVATEAGKRAAETEMVFLPERGTWRVVVCRDSLLPSVVLGVEPRPDGSAPEDRNRRQARAFEPVPDLLRPGLLATSCVGRRGDVRLIDIAEKGERGQEREGALSAHVLVSETGVELSVRGKWDGQTTDSPLEPPNLDYQTVWHQLLRAVHLESAWDDDARALRVSFQNTIDAERVRMTRDLQVDRPELAGLGQFESVRVADVNLRPSSRDEASKWAKWRLLNSLGTYIAEADLPELFREAEAPFADLNPQRPSLLDLAAEARGPDRPPPRFWHLQALADWNVSGGIEQ